MLPQLLPLKTRRWEGFVGIAARPPRRYFVLNVVLEAEVVTGMNLRCNALVINDRYYWKLGKKDMDDRRRSEVVGDYV